MDKKTQFTQSYLKTNLPDLRPGDTIKVYQKIPAHAEASGSKKESERTQVFEGIVIALKHGKGITGTFTVRKISSGIGVERIFPLHCPAIEKIEVVSHGKVRRAKLYYLRKAIGKKAKVKRRDTKEQK